jgi:hypothetical protein
MNKIIAILVVPLLFLPTLISSQEVHDDFQGTFRGMVTEVVSREEKDIPGTDTKHIYQVINAEILGGPKKGEVSGRYVCCW